MDGVQDTSGGTNPTSLNPNPNPTLVPEMSTAALLECKLCDLTFETHEEKRQHAKSDWHVYKIRCKVAEPGVSITPPDIELQRPASRQKARKQTSRKPELESPAVDDENELKDKDASASDSDLDSESDDTPDPSDTDGVEFIPGACLFCDYTSDDLDNNLTHMRQTHSFLIPFQSSLAVDLQTLLWFLHMVIFSYRECICCGKRRRTVEAVQQHMVSTGHCRFDVSEETKMFYDQEVMESQGVQAQASPDEQTLRLPSGKLLTRRPERVGEGSSGSRTRERL
ncbi:hypothetical protein VTJ04DRAFT_10413 [Mycothermus thermophilus]|uniref:uncharacterized protein n=1 Tax=Humicola insolens TaxID=85995 RepID=UPI003742BA42